MSDGVLPTAALEAVAARLGAPVAVTDWRHGVFSDCVTMATPSGDRWVCKLYGDGIAPKGRRELEYQAQLSLAGVPIAGFPHQDPAAAWIEWDGGGGVLTRFVAHGDELGPPAASDAGRVLAMIHGVNMRARLDAWDTGRDEDDVARTLDRAGEADDELCRWAKNCAEVWDVVAGTTWGELEFGICHGDYRQQNVLISGGKVAAVIDWDRICRGPLLLDLAYALVFFRAVLQDEPMCEDETLALIQGYVNLHPLPEAERALLPRALRWSWCRGIALWLRIAMEMETADRAHGGDEVAAPHPVRRWLSAYATDVSWLGEIV